MVFLPVADTSADGTDAVLQRLREGAVLATDICFTISDPRQDDDPLVWVNPAFTRVTGYAFDEVVGRNCRFLQGPATDRAALQELREGMAERRPVTVTLLNHRKDGTAFWNQLSVSPVFDGRGELVSFVGVQSDVSQRVVADAERDRAFRAETTAREVAEQAQRRLLLMAEGTGLLSATLDTAELLRRLARICVPELAEWAFVVGLDDDGQVARSAAAHTEGDRPELSTLMEMILGWTPYPGSPAARAVAEGAAVLHQDLTTEQLAPFFRTATGLQLVTDLGMPLPADHPDDRPRPDAGRADPGPQRGTFDAGRRRGRHRPGPPGRDGRGQRPAVPAGAQRRRGPAALAAAGAARRSPG